MTQKTDYTPADWELLQETPLLVGGAVLVSANSGFFGTIKEGVAMIFSPLEAAKLFPDNQLIQNLILLEKNGEPNPDHIAPPDAPVEDIKIQAIASCQKVVKLLQEKSSPQEAQEYKQWLLMIAEKVAKAAKEGSFLGIGGQLISPEENNTIAQIATALGINYN